MVPYPQYLYITHTPHISDIFYYICHMSRSTKKPIVKDNPKGRRALYWRTTRRVINEAIRHHKETLPLEKEIVNDYDYSDYKFFSDRPCDTRK